MRWPWTRRHLGALEVETLPPYTVRVVGVDRREVDRVVKMVMNAADSAGAQTFINYATVTEDGTAIPRRQRGDYITNLTKPEIRQHGFPEDFYGKMAFWRNIQISGDEGEAIAAIGALVPGSLVRISIE
jgi:hypothetical protein